MINHRQRSSFELLTVWMFPCQMKILNLDHYMIRPLQWLNSWNVTGTVYTLEQKDVSVCCLLWWLSRAVWAEQHELYSVHLNSVPDQPGRKWIYHWIREAKSLLSNIYTVLTGFCRLSNVAFELEKSPTLGSIETEAVKRRFSVATHEFNQQTKVHLELIPGMYSWYILRVPQNLKKSPT